MINQDRKVISLKEIVGGGYKEFWNSRHLYLVVKGSRGSKKSKTTALRLIYNLMKYPDSNILVVRNTGATLKDSCFAELKWAANRLGVYDYFHFTQNPLEITYKPTNQKILFRGFDDPLKLTSVTVPRGVLCWVWIEEAYELQSEEDFNKLDMSIRGELPDGLWKQFIFTFNPWSGNHWLKARFFDTPDPDVLALTTTYRCNEWLDEQDIKKFEKMKIRNPRRYAIEGDGEWGISEGLIYENFKVERFDPDFIRRQKGMKSAFGLDFGYTDPNALVCMLVDMENERIYVFDELYETGLTNTQIANRIKDMGYGGQRIVADSAEPKAIKELNTLGLKVVPSRKGRDSVNHGIQLLQNFEWIIHPKCENFHREISNYCWQKDKQGKPIDKPEHDFSHTMDAARYGLTKMLLGSAYSFD